MMTEEDAKAKHKRIEDICNLCEADDIGLKAAADSIEKELAAQGLLTMQVVPPLRTGFSPRNRDEYGGCPMDALDLINTIVQAGFSEKEMEHATFEQSKPGTTDIEDYNKETSAGDPASAPVIPPIQYGSIACGHTYAGFRAFHAGVLHDNELITKDGRLSLEKLAERDSLYAEKARHGVLSKVPGAREGRTDGQARSEVLLDASLQICGEGVAALWGPFLPRCSIGPWRSCTRAPSTSSRALEICTSASAARARYN